MEQFFVPFMLSYVKELKSEFIQFMIPPKLQSIVDLLKVPKNPNTFEYDFTKLSDQQYYQFRHAFVEEKLFYETYRKNSDSNAIESILNVLCMVICNRVPKTAVTYKTDELNLKIKLSPIPKGVEIERRIIIEKEQPSEEFPEGREIETVIEPNTNEKAVVRIRVPTKQVLQSELVPEQPNSPSRSPSPDRKTPESGDRDKSSEKGDDIDKHEEKKEDVLVDVEEDQNDMALQVSNRIGIAQPPYSVYIIHQYAQRAHR